MRVTNARVSEKADVRLSRALCVTRCTRNDALSFVVYFEIPCTRDRISIVRTAVSECQTDVKPFSGRDRDKQSRGCRSLNTPANGKRVLGVRCHSRTCIT